MSSIAKWSECYEKSESSASVMVKAIVRSIYARKTTKKHGFIDFIKLRNLVACLKKTVFVKYICYLICWDNVGLEITLFFV